MLSALLVRLCHTPSAESEQLGALPHPYLVACEEIALGTRRAPRLAVLAILLAVVCAGATLTGVVLDPSGAPAPGALVTLRPTERTALTDYQGVFRFEDLPQGRYELEVRREHFKTARLWVSVGPRSGRPLRIVLELARLEQKLTVTDAAGLSTNPAENPDVVQLDPDLLKSLPVLNLDVLGAAALFLDPAQIGARGHSLVVDGMETDRLGVTASAIREVRINQNPYSAEFSSPGRGRLEVTTAKAESAYHGQFNLILRHHRLDARNAFAASGPRQQRRTFEGHLTGPLGRSRKLSFLLSGSREIDHQESVVFAQTLAGLVRQQVPRVERDAEFNFRLNYQPDARRSFAWRYEIEADSTRGDDIGGVNLPEVGTDGRDREQALYFTWQAVHSPRWLHQFQARPRRQRGDQTSRTPGVPKLVVEDAFVGGGGQNEQLQRHWRVELSDLWSWSSTRHWLKLGAAATQLDRTDFHDLSHREGIFYFSSLEDYAARRPFAFTRQSGSGRLRFWNVGLAGFLQDDFRWRPNLSFGLGLRYERFLYPGDSDNFAPRFSFAWAPGARPKTVLRGGAGLFYERLGGGSVRNALLFDGLKLRRVLLVDPGFPDPFAGAGFNVQQPPAIVRLSPRLGAPYLLHSSLGLSRPLTPKATLTITYAEIRGLKQFRSRDANAPVPPDFTRPNPALSTVRTIESSARMAGRSLEAGLRGSLTRWFNGAVLYSLGRTFNDSDGPDSLPADSLDLSREWARAAFDRLHRFHLAGKLTAAEWFEVGLILQLESGAPYSLTTGRDDNRDGSARDRPHGVARNSLQGTGLAVLDVRWERKFPIREPIQARLLVDAFNALNRVNYTRWVGNLSSPFFGRPVAARPARRLQLGLRLEF